MASFRLYWFITKYVVKICIRNGTFAIGHSLILASHYQCYWMCYILHNSTNFSFSVYQYVVNLWFWIIHVHNLPFLFLNIVFAIRWLCDVAWSINNLPLLFVVSWKECYTGHVPKWALKSPHYIIIWCLSILFIKLVANRWKRLLRFGHLWGFTPARAYSEVLLISSPTHPIADPFEFLQVLVVINVQLSIFLEEYQVIFVYYFMIYYTQNI